MIKKIILLIFVNFIAAITFPVGKLALCYANPFFLTGMRMVIAGILLLLYERFTHKKYPVFTKKFIILLLALSFFNVFFTNCLQFWALQYTTSAKATFIFNMSPFIAAVLSYFLYGETMTIRKVVALAISFIGFFPILISDSAQFTNLKTFLFIDIAEATLFIAALTSVLGWFIMKRLLQTTQCSLVFANGASMFLGGSLFFPLAWYTQGPHWYHVSNIPFTAFLLLLLIIANNIINYNAYAYFIKHISATLMFLISFTGPLFALFFGWWFLGEKIGISFLITTVIVGVGLTLYYREEKRIIKEKTFLNAP